MHQVKPNNGAKLPMVLLHPGELFVAKEPAIITTILGSCVSVCIHCPKKLTGAMCHSVMPDGGRGNLKDDIFRFVDTSVHYMVDVLTGGEQICSTSGLIAKIFGGATVLSVTQTDQRAASSIGKQNIEAARQALAKNKVRITVEKVGGSEGCKLFYYPHTGDVYYRGLSR